MCIRDRYPACGAGHRPGLRGAHLRRRVAVRRGLCRLPDRGRAVPSGPGAQAADPRHHRAGRVHVHDDGVAGHAGDPERDPDALLRHHTLRRARPGCDRWRGDAGRGLVVDRAAREVRPARRRGLRRRCGNCRRCPPVRDPARGSRHASARSRSDAGVDDHALRHGDCARGAGHRFELPAVHLAVAGAGHLLPGRCALRRHHRAGGAWHLGRHRRLERRHRAAGLAVVARAAPRRSGSISLEVGTRAGRGGFGGAADEHRLPGRGSAR